MSLHLVVNVIGAVCALIAAVCWFRSARIAIPDNIDTIVGELQRVGYWNGRAAAASCVAAFFTMLALLPNAGYSAQAAEATVINLSCDGTFGIAGDPVEKLESVKKFGLIVNLAARTVSGFANVAPITNLNDATVEFNGATSGPLGTSTIWGTIDRVTGKTSAWTIGTAKDGKIIMSDVFDLVCKVTNRLF